MRQPLPLLASPAEQLALEEPALRARRMIRVQVATIATVSALVVLLGVLCVAVPADDRSPLLVVIAVTIVGGSVLVGFADFLHARSLARLMGTASGLRHAAAERAAELARANAELRRRDDERAAFFTTISHELRTPLGAIVRSGRALLDDEDGTLNDDQRADIRQIQQRAKHLLGIVNQTVDFARLQAGAVELTLRPVRLAPLMDEVVQTMRPLALARGLTLGHSVSPTMPPVEADEESLRQVLFTLVSNAVQFTDIGSISVRAETAGSVATIVVEDTGAGIAPEHLPTVFEPFRQGLPGRSPRGIGTGLGLAICQRTIDLMGGRIWVESEPEGGATFTVSLPLARLRSVPAGPTARSFQNTDVLVVGEPVRVGPFLASLRSFGLDALTVSADTPIGDLMESPPRLVLVDLLSRQQAGWRALAELSATASRIDTELGLVGLVDGGGRVAIPTGLNVLSTDQIERQLEPWIRTLQIGPEGSRRRSDASALVVGDDLSWRRQVCAVLTARGIRSFDCRTAGEALALGQRHAPRLVLADLLLADGGGLGLLGELQRVSWQVNAAFFLIGPAALAPSQQLALHRDALRWAREASVAVSDLAQMVADDLAAPAHAAVRA